MPGAEQICPECLKRVKKTSKAQHRFVTQKYSMQDSKKTSNLQAGYTVLEVHIMHVKHYSPPEDTQDVPASQPVEQQTAFMQPEGDTDPVREQHSPAAVNGTDQQSKHQEVPPTPDLTPFQTERSVEALPVTRPAAERAEHGMPTPEPTPSPPPLDIAEPAPRQWRARCLPTMEQSSILARLQPS
ncbi:hypothetical protein PR048_020891 [Dryococelus australis]|uniref:Uncharacterized protein n=1 Tax=Dryococelus australis TaxID=614101 RepID=A0ABQ9GWN6_9NEOP|nr:hypothetical protein PR048_020891 [Dryococelus australis]